MTDEYYQGDNSHQKRLEIKVVLPDSAAHMVVANLLQNNINNNITKFLQNVKILQNAEKGKVI